MKKRPLGGPCFVDEAFKRMARPGLPVELSHAEGVYRCKSIPEENSYIDRGAL